MAKFNKNNQPDKNATVTFADPRMAYSSTKKEMVIAETNLTVNDIFNNDDKSIAVIAEDQNGLYITSKSIVGAPILDGYRMYRRNEVKVERINDNSFNIASQFASFDV